MADLDEALAVTRTDDGHWLAFADPRYEARTSMFGGWTAAVALRGVMESAGGIAKPSAITVNYIAAVLPGTEVVVRAQPVGAGRSLHHWRAEVVSLEEERALALAMVVLAERRDSDGRTEPTMPEVPDPDSLEVFHPPGPHGERTMIRPIFGHPPFRRDTTVSSAWVRDISGRQVDHIQLAYLADAYAPRPFFWSDGPRPSATVTLSVYFHATDEEIAAVGDDYVLNEATGTRGAQSTSGQQMRLWSRRGDLLVTSEQLQWFR